jgi:predicted AAA+ superfamily ATPase
MVDRLISEKIESSTKSCLILGPRQVGKSTLIQNLQPELVINLARESEYHLYTSQPGRLEQVVEARPVKTVFIDEIQRVPSLLNSVQALVDEHKGRIKFYLSGSSARKLRRGQANLLPGRLMVFNMGGLCGAEIPPKTSTEKLLQYGCLPEIALSSDRAFCASLLDAYAGTYLREEIKAEALVQSLEGFSRFLTEAALMAGHILDYSKIAKRAKISRTSCVRFFEILQDTLMVDRCDVFDDVNGAEPIKHPKFFFFDNGVRNALVGSFDLSPERRGVVFEHFIFNQMRNSAVARNLKFKIQYFRTRTGLEVDFVVQIGKKLWAIEVKAGVVFDDDLKSLRSFSALARQPVTCLAVGLKETAPRKYGQVLICDWRTMLSEMGL